MRFSFGLIDFGSLSPWCWDRLCWMETDQTSWQRKRVTSTGQKQLLTLQAPKRTTICHWLPVHGCNVRQRVLSKSRWRTLSLDFWFLMLLSLIPRWKLPKESCTWFDQSKTVTVWFRGSETKLPGSETKRPESETMVRQLKPSGSETKNGLVRQLKRVLFGN